MTIDLRSLPQKIAELDIGIADQKSGRLLFEKGSYHYAVSVRRRQVLICDDFCLG